MDRLRTEQHPGVSYNGGMESDGVKAVVNTVGGLLASRRIFSCYRCFFLFLFDRFRLNHLLKHANKKNLATIAAMYQ